MITTILCSIMLLSGMNAKATEQQSVAVTQSDDQTAFTVDSISRAPSDEHCSVELVVDFPTAGPQALVDSVRSYIGNEMKSFYMARLDGDGLPRPANYEGSLSDGKALVDFHADHLLSDMKDIYQSFVDSTGVKDTYMVNQSSIRKTSENDSIVTYESGCYQFEGGAHGLYWLEGATFRKSDGTRILINLDPFKVDQMQPLLKAGVDQYLKDNGAQTTVDDLIKGGVFMADGEVPLPSTQPYLTADGVKFVYQEYEIAPYAAGLPTFTIPLKDLEPFIEHDDE